ncbi:MAG TPA: peptide chain release factor 2 [bacterium]|nr:peptide chain release factor 2 [bacterium]
MGGGFDLAAKEKELKELEQQAQAEDLWSRPQEAGQLLKKIETVQTEIDDYQQLIKRLADLDGLAKLADGNETDSLIQEELVDLEKKIDTLEGNRFFDQSHDDLPVILSIHAGTGGVDAQDWTAMLERMYLRLADRQGWSSQIIEEQAGNEAGFKSVVIRLSGHLAYGKLRGEGGTHRLLRNSPFNAQHLRQTSFAMVEVLPELPAAEAPVVADSDLQIDVFRSSGPGGQGVNTTDSAVRLTHLPTGIVVTCQTERSQHQNKALALAVLQAKLAQKQIEELDKTKQTLKGEQVKADWGLQIRSYFMYGSQIVKDHRTDVATSNVAGVLDGDLDIFLKAYWLWDFQRRQ